MTPVKALFTIDAPTPAAVFVGYHDPSLRWNGWATPSFERSEVERIIAWVNSDQTDVEYHRFKWDGDTLVHDQPEYADEAGYEPERLEPFEGRYGLGAFGWTWSELENDDEDLSDDDWIAYHLQRRDIFSAVYEATLAALENPLFHTRSIVARHKAAARDAGMEAVDAISRALDPAFAVPAWFMPMIADRASAWTALGVDRQRILVDRLGGLGASES